MLSLKFLINIFFSFTLLTFGTIAHAEIGEEIEIVSAQGDSNLFFPASNVLDGRTAHVSVFASRSNPGDLFLDLGKLWNVENIKIAWGRGDNRSYEFEIATRADEYEDWATVFNGNSTGRTRRFEIYDVTDSEAQFVRIRSLSNSLGNSWTLIAEVEAYGSPATIETPEEITIKSASGVSNVLFPASNVLDGKRSHVSVFASAANPKDLFLDLGQTWNVENIRIAWGRGDNRTYEFEIATRANEYEDWSRVFYGNSTGTTREFERYDVTNSKAQLIRIRTLSNSLGNAWTLISEVRAYGSPAAAQELENTTTVKHFGQPITLVGANVPWSSDSNFSTDFGWYNPTNIEAYRSLFSRIQDAGGNSARVWVHTTAQVTPNIDPSGTVLSLSRISPDKIVIEQLRSVLDEAWERGIVVTFSLFSFDMFCDSYGDEFGYNSYLDMERHQIMMEKNFKSYIEKALTPIVNGLKDHPGLFAYEVLNEPEGAIINMTDAGHFCLDEANVPGDGLSFPLSLAGAQRFVNHVAAAIHELDPNVKVTTATHTNFYTVFNNETLTSQDGADETGTLDFYELHHYPLYQNPPYITNADVYEADRPIIIGEYDLADVQQESLFQIEGPDSLKAIIYKGYLGAWPWSLLNDDLGEIDKAISQIPASETAIDREAVETCIETQDSACYNQ